MNHIEGPDSLPDFSSFLNNFDEATTDTGEDSTEGRTQNAGITAIKEQIFIIKLDPNAKGNIHAYRGLKTIGTETYAKHYLMTMAQSMTLLLHLLW